MKMRKFIMLVMSVIFLFACEREKSATNALPVVDSSEVGNTQDIASGDAVPAADATTPSEDVAPADGVTADTAVVD